MTERLKVHDWKSCGRVKLPRGFESHPLRLRTPPVRVEPLLERRPASVACGLGNNASVMYAAAGKIVAIDALADPDRLSRLDLTVLDG